MSAKQHEKCAVCGGLVHIGHDGEMARVAASQFIDSGKPIETMADFAVHSACRDATGAYQFNRRRGNQRDWGRRLHDRQRQEGAARMGELRRATPRKRRRLLREWFGS